MARNPSHVGVLAFKRTAIRTLAPMTTHHSQELRSHSRNLNEL
jgi:hypothetical protein